MRSQDNITELSQKDSINIINPSTALNFHTYNFDSLPKPPIPLPPSLPNQSLSSTPSSLSPKQLFTDYTFKLPSSKQTSTIKIRRLCEIYPNNVSLFIDLKTGKEMVEVTKKAKGTKGGNMWVPSYLGEIEMLGFRHLSNLIDPPYLNEKGYYYVVVCRDGVLSKQLIDDKFYYDQSQKTLITHPSLSPNIWVHILIKTWAKLNKSYDNLKSCPPFSFIRTFSLPDWEVMNPNKERKEAIIAKLAKATNKIEYIVGKTKDDFRVGYFGFVGNCAQYVVDGHYQEYGDIYVKITSYTLGGWNSHISHKGSHPPQQPQNLSQNQFLMPIQQFLNVFHLLYSTYNKYSPTPASISHSLSQSLSQPQSNPPPHSIPRSLTLPQSTSLKPPPQIYSINYQKYHISIDALSKHAVMIGMDVSQDKGENLGEGIHVAVSFYFPHVQVFDLVKNLHQADQKIVVPWSKVMIGRAADSCQYDTFQMEVMKEGLIKYNSQGLMSFNMHKNNHEYVLGNYFKGYANQVTYSLTLRPGKYYIRLKTQQIISEYNCSLTAVTINGSTKFYDPKLSHEDETSFLEDCLFKKAVNEKKGVTFINPAKRGSWISCRDEEDTVGYSYIAVHVVKNADNKIVFRVNPSVLKEHGYIVKQHKDMVNFQITIDSEQNTLIIFKHDKEWKGTGKRIWPPPGIEFRKIRRQTNNNRLSKNSSKISS